MLFNSIAFLIFFPATVLIYWLLPQRARNIFLLLASYYFYMNWEPVYAILILASSLTSYTGALAIAKFRAHRRLWLTSVLVINLGILFTYKYARFAGGVLQTILQSAGLAIDIPEFNLLLPVGISFYTFQAVGYIVDVYRGTIRPERNLTTYMLFVAFFPQLVAGPIERASNMLPQFHKPHRFNGDRTISGLELMIMGYVMKTCIADNLAPFVNSVYANLQYHNGLNILIATLFFSFEIYCDFAGYTYIATGAARCMGFDLVQNFRRPYLATSMRDFWRRWHISLSRWMADYIYIPLGGSRCSPARHKFNLIATFVISGLWHGAGWTFAAWGLFHGMLMALESTLRNLRKKWAGKYRRFTLPANAFTATVTTILSVALTFTLVMLSRVLYRAPSLDHAFLAMKKMLSPSGPLYKQGGTSWIILDFAFIIILIIVEIFLELKEKRDKEAAKTGASLFGNPVAGGVISGLMIAFILMCGNLSGEQFFYFQF